MNQFGKSDEEYAKALQAEFDKDFNDARKQEDKLKFGQDLTDFHQISDSESDDSITEINASKDEKKQLTQSDSVSKDETQPLMSKTKNKKQKSPTVVKSPITKLHEMVDSDEEPDIVPAANNVSFKVIGPSFHNLSLPETIQESHEEVDAKSLEKQGLL